MLFSWKERVSTPVLPDHRLTNVTEAGVPLSAPVVTSGHQEVDEPRVVLLAGGGQDEGQVFVLHVALSVGVYQEQRQLGEREG